MSGKFDVYSAGVEKHGMNQMAVQVMSEDGIDITAQWSKTTDELPVKEFEYVITVCDNAREQCPWFPSKTRIIHQSFPDPPYLTRDITDIQAKLVIYREVRDKIRSYVENLPGLLGQ
jgi:arsenate reductase